MGHGPRGHRGRAILAVLAGGALSGCHGMQSALDPAGPQAARIGDLWWLMLIVCTVVFVIVGAFLFIALFRRRPAETDARQADRGATRAVAAGAAVTAAILIVFLVASVATGRMTNTPGDAADPLVVEVTGHQWWWQFRILGERSSDTVETANELHIPARRTVKLELLSRDVIHSFWVPNLQGKIDLIPGQKNVLWLEAERPGVYRGQCAEFCGVQHAHMGMLVVVEPEEQWQRWLENQRRPGRPPRTAAEQRGQRVFLTSPCVLCHTIRGTGAFGRVAPDLTHLASRRTLAAATLPNRRGQLAGWVLDSQHVKPGNRMPPIQLAGEELQDLLTYLESLD